MKSDPFKESTGSSVEENRRQDDEERAQIKSTVDIEDGFACSGKSCVTMHFLWLT